MGWVCVDEGVVGAVRAVLVVEWSVGVVMGWVDVCAGAVAAVRGSDGGVECGGGVGLIRWVSVCVRVLLLQ